MSDPLQVFPRELRVGDKIEHVPDREAVLSWADRWWEIASIARGRDTSSRCFYRLALKSPRGDDQVEIRVPSAVPLRAILLPRPITDGLTSAQCRAVVLIAECGSITRDKVGRGLGPGGRVIAISTIDSLLALRRLQIDPDGRVSLNTQGRYTRPT